MMVTHISKGRFFGLILLGLYVLVGVTILSTVSNHSLRGKSQRHINDRSRVFDFSNIVRTSSRSSKTQWCQPLRFLKDLSRPMIALVSYPGSGNTWLRYLIQQATGINTGSVYKDFGLLKNGFPGEFVIDSSVIVVKTHEIGPSAHAGFRKAVLLVRDPQQAIQAEFNRQGGGHVGIYDFRAFIKGGQTSQRVFIEADVMADENEFALTYVLLKRSYWEKFVSDQIIKWRDTNLDWLFNFTKPTFVIFYDQLVSNLESNLREILKFLEVNVTESHLQCALIRREGIFRRKKKLINRDNFTKDMKQRIEEVKQEVYSLIYQYLEKTKQNKLPRR